MEQAKRIGEKLKVEISERKFVMDDECLKQGKTSFGKDYFKELLERVCSIMSSKRRICQRANAFATDKIFKIYTTSIMTTKEKGVIVRYVIKISGVKKLPERNKDMTTMNRFSYLHSEQHYSASIISYDGSFSFVNLFRDKHRRLNCVKESAGNEKA